MKVDHFTNETLPLFSERTIVQLTEQKDKQRFVMFHHRHVMSH